MSTPSNWEQIVKHCEELTNGEGYEELLSQTKARSKKAKSRSA